MPTNVVAMRHYDATDPVNRHDLQIGLCLALAWSFVISIMGSGDKAFLQWAITAGILTSLYFAAFGMPPPRDAKYGDG